MKIINYIHKVIVIISWILLLTGIIRLILTYNILPNEVGVHFDSDGSFDVIVNKSKLLYVCYPYIVSLIIILLSDFIIYISSKVKIGLKVNKEKENIIKSLFKILIDINLRFSWVFFLSFIWSDCVIKQHYLNTAIPVTIFYLQFIIFIAFIITVLIILNKKTKVK